MLLGHNRQGGGRIFGVCPLCHENLFCQGQKHIISNFIRSILRVAYAPFNCFIRGICLCYNLVISIFVFYLSIYLFIYLDFHLFIFSTIISSSIFIIFYMLFVYDRKMLISSTSLLLKLLIK